MTLVLYWKKKERSNSAPEIASISCYKAKIIKLLSQDYVKIQLNNDYKRVQHRTLKVTEYLKHFLICSVYNYLIYIGIYNKSMYYKFKYCQEINFSKINLQI